jgi:hypothetical protein
MRILNALIPENWEFTVSGLAYFPYVRQKIQIDVYCMCSVGEEAQVYVCGHHPYHNFTIF